MRRLLVLDRHSQQLVGIVSIDDLARNISASKTGHILSEVYVVTFRSRAFLLFYNRLIFNIYIFFFFFSAFRGAVPQVSMHVPQAPAANLL